MIHLFIAILSAFLLVLTFWVNAKKIKKQSWARSARADGREETATEEEQSNIPMNRDVDASQVARAFRIGDMHFSRGAFEEAEQWFIKVLALNDAHAEALNLLGVVYIQQGNSRRAEIIYRKLLSITQKEATYYCNYGRCLYNQKRFDEAIEAYENAIKLDSTKSSRYVSAGQIYYERKFYVKALACFVKALDLEPLNVDFLNHTVEIAELAGDGERLHKSLKKLAELEPYNEAVKKKMAEMGIK